MEKRFMAYEIIKRLEAMKAKEVLYQLSSFVNATEKRRGKLHEVFEPSFDWKECNTEKFVEQKLTYIHENPCREPWDLAMQPHEYKHSSAKYYTVGEQGIYEVMDYMKLEDVDLTKTS
jgi:hypothetical protein